MRKDITKKCLMIKNTNESQTPIEFLDFISRKKINKNEDGIRYDEIEFGNVFSIKFTKLNTKNFSNKISDIVVKNDKSIAFNMIYCGVGKLTMGGIPSFAGHPNPKRDEVIDRPFLLGETEVTQELYELVMGYNPSHFKDAYNTSQRPVDSVTWYDAIKFCDLLSDLMGRDKYYRISGEIYAKDKNGNILKNIERINDIRINKNANGFRLPYEKEWEYAAKAGTENKWSGTNDESQLGEYAWYVDNSNYRTHIVATKKPNEWGFYDMSGNVQEWCWNAFNGYRIARGSIFFSDASSPCCNFRSLASSGEINNYTMGFRIASFL